LMDPFHLEHQKVIDACRGSMLWSYAKESFLLRAVLSKKTSDNQLKKLAKTLLDFVIELFYLFSLLELEVASAFEALNILLSFEENLMPWLNILMVI